MAARSLSSLGHRGVSVCPGHLVGETGITEPSLNLELCKEIRGGLTIKIYLLTGTHIEDTVNDRVSIYNKS